MPTPTILTRTFTFLFAIALAAPALAGDPPSDKAQRDLAETTRRLVTLVDALEAPLTTGDFDAAGKKWKEIEGVLEKAGHPAECYAEVRVRLVTIARKHRDQSPIFRSFLLRSFYDEGEAIVAAIEAVLKKPDRPAAEALLEKLRGHAKRMEEADAQFGEAAKQLVEKGEALLAPAPK